jgi:hexosaminidase
LIPQPVSATWTEGVFSLAQKTVRTSGPFAAEARKLAEDWGLSVDASRGVVRFEKAGGISAEGYELSVSPAEVVVRASDAAGAFYAAQTLRQMKGDGPDLPCAEIRDQPRFPWRGLMLDCSRTFQSMDYLRKTVDRLAAYKMNVLHLHLTDDQGWRMEIRKHPELTRKGARFPERWKEPADRQGFYTQAEMRELATYAAARQVVLVPEIEMPGHSLAALSVYPPLSCTGASFEISPFGKGPGIRKDIFCAGNEDSFRFFEDVLAEVAEIFPSKFVHIGGDEAPKNRWKACPKCQARIKAEGLKDEEELQSYFIRRAERILARHGKRMIGWDEILEGGLAPNAAVMSWRGTRGGLASARAGHDVVMSPTSHCYFDYTYLRIDSERAYAFEPVPPELSAEQAKHILGLQANFWSHIDRTPGRVDYQLFPRLLSLAERAWSPKECRDWPDFLRRARAHASCLTALGIRYNASDLAPSAP